MNKSRKRFFPFSLLLAVTMVLSLLFGNVAQASLITTDTPAYSSSKLRMATTTSTNDTGLLQYLEPYFKAAYPQYDWEWRSVGTGKAIQLGKSGYFDVLLTHAKAAEEEFVDDGYGHMVPGQDAERVPFMFNQFILVGPDGGPIDANENILDTFETIYYEQMTFVSRGDNSGTHMKEKEIWTKLGLDPTVNPNYISAYVEDPTNAGMLATLDLAADQDWIYDGDTMTGAYCLTDNGTWIVQQFASPTTLENLEVVTQNDIMQRNQYAVIAVNPDMFTNMNLNTGAAEAFVNWITSPSTLALIDAYGVSQYNQALFETNFGEIGAR